MTQRNELGSQAFAVIERKEHCFAGDSAISCDPNDHSSYD